ncbi:MAG: hypothetical protein V4621_03185 [Pseudomonadota bacterium]
MHMDYGALQKIGIMTLAFSLVGCVPSQDRSNQAIKRCLVSRLGGVQTPFYINVVGSGQPEIFDERGFSRRKNQFPTHKDVQKAVQACVPRRKHLTLG